MYQEKQEPRRSRNLGAVGLELGYGGVDLLAVLVVADTGRGQTVAAALARTHTNDVGVDGARHTVDHLDVQLRKSVLCNDHSKQAQIGQQPFSPSGQTWLGLKLTLVDRGVGQVTDSSSLNNVADSESLDGLVLGHGASAVGASHKGDVASAGLVAAVFESKW